MGFSNPRKLHEHCTHPDHVKAAWPTNPCISLTCSQRPGGLWLPPTSWHWHGITASWTIWSSSTQVRRDAQVPSWMSRSGHQRGSLASRWGSSHL